VSPKQIARRPIANRDVDDAIDHYLREADQKTALRFLDSLEDAYRHISRHPASGSPRYGQELGLSDLRSWPLQRYPYLVLFVEREDHIDVWRVLHAERDIPAHLREPQSN
jgi:toxin ParE1/3/4